MSVSTPRKLWEHPDPESSNMGRFKQALERRQGQRFQTFHDMHKWSVQNTPQFYSFLWEYSGLVHQGNYTKIVDKAARMDSIPTWFEGVKCNFAENLLFSPGGGKVGKEDDKMAVTEVDERGARGRKDGDAGASLTWGQLRQSVGRLAQAMKANGVVAGDRIATVSCHNVNTLLVFLASTALGAVFSSSSTDMGVQGVLERLRQIKPRWVFVDDSALYNGKEIDLREKMTGIAEGMRSIPDFKGIVSQARFKSRPRDVERVPGTQTIREFVSRAASDELVFQRVDFRDPFLIVYSSGTTGQPKCIVHSVGGALLNAFKEGSLHQEIGSRSVTLQFTTTSWIMYFAAVQALLFGAHMLLYDGSPFLPGLTSLIDLSAQNKVTHLGVSPKYLYELQRAGVKPREIADLSSLEMLTSTGMVFPDALFEWFYDEGFPAKVRVNNQSGGTDIAGCFGISNALTPVYVGGCSGLGLGIAVEVYDSTVEGEHVPGSSVEDGTPGELVVTTAFPNMPVMFWGKGGSERYHDAYFARFDNVWTHGDFVMIHPTTKQLMFLGRSDGILNPSGVRFGSAEIYTVIERDFPNEVAESICVGQRRPTDNDERVFLFLHMKPGVEFTKELADKVKVAIRKGLSARHVPAYVFPTPEIPATINGKKVELPVKRIISGDRVKPSGTLANPQSLDYYYQFAKVEELSKPMSKL